MPIYVKLAESLGLPGYWLVVTWNDARGRTKDEVVSALRNAAKA